MRSVTWPPQLNRPGHPSMLGPDMQKIDALPCFDLNVRHFKAEPHALMVSCRWPSGKAAPFSFPSCYMFLLHISLFMFLAAKHNICKCEKLICSPSVPAVPDVVSLWAMRHGASSRFRCLEGKPPSRSPPFLFCFLTSDVMLVRTQTTGTFVLKYIFLFCFIDVCCLFFLSPFFFLLHFLLKFNS